MSGCPGRVEDFVMVMRLKVGEEEKRSGAQEEEGKQDREKRREERAKG